MLIAAVALAVLVIGAVAARGEVAQSGNLRIAFDARFAPRKLPRQRPAPITLRVEGRVATVDGTRPPPLKRLTIELNRAVSISPEGVPACTAGDLQSKTSEAALERCRDALVGGGRFSAILDLGSPVKAFGRVLVFNGRRGDRPTLFLHLFVALPVRATLVVPLTIAQRRTGDYGTVLSARVPPLAAGLGSVTELRLRIGRSFGGGGRRNGYLSAACPADAEFRSTIFPFARGNLIFRGGTVIRATLNRTCQVR